MDNDGILRLLQSGNLGEFLREQEEIAKETGYDEGYRKGYDRGFIDGVARGCPREDHDTREALKILAEVEREESGA